MPVRHIFAAITLATLCAQTQTRPPQTTIQARKMLWPAGKPTFDTWRPYPIRTLDQLNLPKENPIKLDKYGGRENTPKNAVRPTATGYFHTQLINERWWMIDPLGNLYLDNAVVDLHPGQSNINKAAFTETFKTPEAWTSQTRDLLLANGIHSAGAWSSQKLLDASPQQVTQPIAYSINLDIMSAYGKHRGGTHPGSGHLGYPEDTIFVFDPEFPAFADQYLTRIDANANNPNITGYFSDNEIPLYRKNLDGFLKLPETDPGNIAARQWMKDHKATEITDALRMAFLAFEADRYFQIVTTAILKHDPHHIYFGCRYTSQQLQDPELFRAIGKYADAVSINYYSGWLPSSSDMAMWEHESGKPFMITEFYVKAEETSMPNLTGAGWLVHTQRDRGLFYENFVIALLESGKCVGWHWFKYQDNDPSDPAADNSNLNSNKGIVDAQYKTYNPLLDLMRPLNQRLYQIADHFSPTESAPTAH